MSTWQEIVSSFVEGDYHFMESLPQRIEGPWEELCKVHEIPLSMWRVNCSAQDIMEHLQVDGGFAFWQGQLIEMVTLKMYLSRQSRIVEAKVSVLVIEDTRLLRVCCPLLELIEKMPWSFCGRQLQAVRLLSGLGLAYQGPKMGYTIEDRPMVSVFLMTKGPGAEDVFAFKGDPRSSTEIIVTAEMRWNICGRPQQGAIRLEVPESLKFIWLQKSFVPSEKEEFLSKEYYDQNMSYYSSWSFKLHCQQMRGLLCSLDPSVTLVVPGDGIGVCQRIWKGAIVAGDRVKVEFSTVEKESFAQTLERGHKVVGKKVLILSYLWSLLQSKERELLSQWVDPVVIVDVKPSSPIPGFEEMGPGVFARGDISFGRTKAVERNPKWDSVQFSENLVALPQISCLSENMSVKYWKRMRPLGKISKEGVLVIHDPSEYVQFIAQIGEQTVYLGSIGRMTNGPRLLMQNLELDLENRSFYKIDKTSNFVETIKENFSYGEDEQYLFFSTRDPQRLKVSNVSALRKFAGCVSVSNRTLTSLCFRIVAREGHYLRVCTVRGELLWNILEPMSLYLVDKYCAIFGEAGWQLKVHGQYCQMEAPKVAWSPVFDRLLFHFKSLCEGDLMPDSGQCPLGWKNERGQSAVSLYLNDCYVSEDMVRHLLDLGGQMVKPWNQTYVKNVRKSEMGGKGVRKKKK